MKTLDHKLIIYDSNCKVCSSLKNVVLRLTSIRENKIAAYNDLPDDQHKRVDPSQFKNGMALLDLRGDKTVYGVEGIAYIFSSQYKLVDQLFKFKPIYLLFAFLYKTQAYNRYIVATPKSRFKCDCLPDVNVKYRLAYIGITYMLSIFLTLLLGVSLRWFIPGLSATQAAIQMLLIAGTGWFLQIGVALLFMREKRLDYIGHLGSIMVAGLLLQVPGILLSGLQIPAVPILSLLLSSGCMLYLHIHRVRYLELSQAWTVSWFVLLQLTASAWIYYFHLNLLL